MKQLICGIVVIFILMTTGCTMNVTERTSQKNTSRSSTDISTIKIGDPFKDCDISVHSTTEKTVKATTTLRQLSLDDKTGDLDNSSMSFTTTDSIASLVFESGNIENWESITMDELNVLANESLSTTIKTENGRVMVTGMAGMVSVEADNGSVTVSTSDSVFVRANNGVVDVSSTTGGVNIKADNGAITVATAHGGTIVADNGSIEIAISSDSLFSGLTVSASNGEVIMYVPRTLNANLSLSSDNGSISYPSNVGDHSKLNNGGPTITCTTENGSITLKFSN